MRKLSVRSMATLSFCIITVSVLYFMSQMAGNWRMNTAHLDFTSQPPYMTLKDVSGTEQTTNISFNLIQQRNIQQVKRELNYLTVTRKDIYPANRIGRYIFSNPNLCESVHNVNFIIIVHTATTHFERRQRIRATFGNTTLFYPAHIRVAFLLGKTLNTTLMEKLLQEHRTYNDTVMGDFIDDYHNLTLKAVLGLRWLKDHCPNANFVLKIDDDVFINMFRLVRVFLPQFVTNKRTIFCNVWHTRTMPIRRQGKWKLESHIFPNRTFFPYEYCSGFTVIITPDLIDLMYQAALITPYLWVDDFYIFGILPFVVGNVSFHDHPLHKNISLKYQPTLDCMMSQGVRCPIFSTIIPDYEYWSYWNVIRDIYRTTNRTLVTRVFS